MSQPLWGIDLGGTKVEGVVIPGPGNVTPIVRKRVDTEAVLGYPHIVARITQLVEGMKKESGRHPGTIGIGTPGESDPVTGNMKNCNSVVLNGRPLQRDLENALGVPVILANDANCFALAEAHWGVVKEKYHSARVVFGIIMGTGVGGGIVLDGRTWNGKHGIAGEWGHNFLDDSGGYCYCGKKGCVETVLSGPALEKYYYSLSGKDVKLKDIVHQATTGERFAVDTLERLYHFFGKAVSVVVDILDPEVIVVGGGVGNIPGLYTEGIASLSSFIFNNRLDVPVVPPSLGDSAGVFGAAALTLQS